MTTKYTKTSWKYYKKKLLMTKHSFSKASKATSPSPHSSRIKTFDNYYSKNSNFVK